MTAHGIDVDAALREAAVAIDTAPRSRWPAT